MKLFFFRKNRFCRAQSLGAVDHTDYISSVLHEPKLIGSYLWVK